MAIVSVGLTMLVYSWRAWPDPLVDFGREVYVAWQLAVGKTLYTDVAYFNGPLSPYLNSLWFRIFGTSISTLALANIALLALLTGLLYRLLNAASDRLSAAVACVMFLTLFAFAQYVGIGNYNFVAPYSHEVSHGLILSVASVASLATYARRRRGIWIVCAGFTLGLVFLTKIEVFLAAAAATLGGLGLILWTERPSSARTVRLALGAAGAALVAPTVAYLLLASAMTPGQALQGILGQWVIALNPDVVSLPFYEWSMGTDDVARNAGRMAAWFAGYLAMLVPAAAVALALRGTTPYRRVVAVLLFVVVVSGLPAIVKPLEWLEVARPLPLIVLLIASWRTVSFLRQPGPADQWARGILQITLLLLAGALLAKMVLNARLYHYGFALAMPGTLLVAVALVGWIPAVIDGLGGYGAAFRSAALGVLLAAVAGHLAVTRYHLDQKTYNVGTGPDAVRSDNIRGPDVARVLGDIDWRLSPEQTLAVLPEGVMLNYLSRRSNPTPYVNFMPLELIVFGEEQVLGAFRATPPDAIVLVHKDTSEHGVRYFGLDYGQALSAWIRLHYRRVLLVGQQPLQEGTEFGIEVLKRRGYPGDTDAEELEILNPPGSPPQPDSADRAAI
ncbi:MAG: glycosyltransferase family 39 protein [Gemmatimonadota bacterium]|nr:MAG: glycosyltransferase family 39 protein [Gemmatimonadota bacterium]